MRTEYFEGITELVTVLDHEYRGLLDVDEYSVLNIIANYDEAKDIALGLIRQGYGLGYFTDFADSDYAGYEDEYLISLFEGEVGIETLKKNGEYIHVDAEAVYILPDCNSKLLKKIESPIMVLVDFGNDEKTNNTCGRCDCENCTPKNKHNILRDDEFSKAAKLTLEMLEKLLEL